MITFDLKGVLSVADRLKLAMLPPARRRRLLDKVMRQAVKDTRQALKMQSAPDGTPWPKRKKGRKKMLSRLGKGLNSHATPDVGTAGWKNKMAGQTAFKHQYGLPELYTKAKARKRSSKAKEAVDQSGPATRHQARLLRQLGYSITEGKRVKRLRKPGIAWIQKNMSFEQAGQTLKMLIAERRNQQPGKTSWEIKVPARPFMEINKQAVLDALAAEFNRRG
ncbi:phage virion morphogenesis protein [Zobellella sp. An-6]|uniref:phage virion morphogenesis protein n=1 Tax=Zobellella sp. An-6 TaxID=3400218 RepID=UPI00404214E1